MSKKQVGAFLAILSVIGLFIGGGLGWVLPAAEGKAQEPTITILPVEWQSDGTITDNEYTSHQKLGEIDVYSRVDGDTVLIGVMAKTKGYIAIGIGAEDRMLGADILMCEFKDGQASVTEMYSKGPYGPHPPKQAGNINIAQVSGSQNDGITTIEFRRKLNPGGKEDKPLKIGENQVIWSMGANTDIDQYHVQRGYGTLLLVQ